MDRDEPVNNKNPFVTKYEHLESILRIELCHIRYKDLLNKKHAQENQELADLIINNSSLDELERIITIIINTKKNSTSITPLLQIIAERFHN